MDSRWFLSCSYGTGIGGSWRSGSRRRSCRRRRDSSHHMANRRFDQVRQHSLDQIDAKLRTDWMSSDNGFSQSRDAKRSIEAGLFQEGLQVIAIGLRVSISDWWIAFDGMSRVAGSIHPTYRSHAVVVIFAWSIAETTAFAQILRTDCAFPNATSVRILSNSLAGAVA